MDKKKTNDSPEARQRLSLCSASAVHAFQACEGVKEMYDVQVLEGVLVMCVPLYQLEHV